MGDPDGPQLRRREVLGLLDRHRVEFVMVGGQAASAHGALRLSTDLDVCVRWSPDNLDRMGEVLVELDAGVRVRGMAEAFPIPHRDGRFIGSMEISTWRSPLGDVDVLRGLPSPHGEVRYDDLLARAETMRVDGQEVKVASLEDIIVSKETTNRPSDIVALPELHQLLTRQHADEAQRGAGKVARDPSGSTLDPQRRPGAGPVAGPGHQR
jgi:hypothetical protein